MVMIFVLIISQTSCLKLVRKYWDNAQPVHTAPMGLT